MPSEKFGRSVVEALVITKDSPESNAYKLYSAFYDNDISQAFKWWERGVIATTPESCFTVAMQLLSGWASDEEIVSMQEYMKRMEEFKKSAKEALERVLR